MSQVGGAFVTAVPAVPAGSVQAFAGSSAPNGWLLCDGTAVSRTTYSSLFSVVSTTFGVGNGSTTFNVPDLRGRVPMGAGTGTGLNASGTGAPTGTAQTARTRGAWGGEETHLLSSAEIPAHSHPVSDAGHTHTIRVNSFAGDRQIALNNVGDGSYYSIGDSGSDGDNSARLLYNTTNTTGLTVSNNTGGGGRHAVVPPFTVLNYIIKWSDDVPRGGMTASWTPPIVTTLPVSPSFGDQVVYAADAANGVYWLLQYDASGTYPWKFVGGSGVTTTTTAYPASQTPASWVNITSGPSWTPPLAGDYLVRHWGRFDISNPTAERLVEISPATNTVAASTYYSAAIGNWVTSGATFRSGWSGERVMQGMLSSEALTLKFQYGVGAVTLVAFYVGMTATPIRVKAA